MSVVSIVQQPHAADQYQSVTIGSIAGTFLAMIRRDLVVASKQLLITVGMILFQPAMLLLALGRIQTYAGAVPPSFAVLILPGVLGSTLVAVAMQSVAMPTVMEFGFTREIEDRLLSPIPTWLVAVEKIFIGICKAGVCCAFYFPVAWLVLGSNLYHADITQPWLFLAVVALTALVMSSFGLFLGSVADSTMLSFLFSVLFVAMSFLGCVFFPWSALQHVAVLKYLTLLNPETYISEGLRGTIAPSLPHMGFLWVFLGLGGWAVLFTFLGMRSFLRKTIN